MDHNIFLAVSIIWAVAAITPGPNFFISVHTAMGTSRILSLFTVAGIVAGTLIWSVSSYLGVTILLQAVPSLYLSLKIAGGMYLIYRGVLLLSQRGNGNTAPPQNTMTAAGCFKLGLLTNLLNPKTAAFITSLFATAVPVGAPASTGLACTLLICTISAIWYSLVASLFSGEFARKTFGRFTTLLQRLAGGIFILFGIKLAIAK